MIHHNKGFSNPPSKLPCYRNIFYISLVPLLPFSSFLIVSHHLCVYSKNQTPLDHKLVGLDYSPNGVVNPKPIGKNKRMNMWGWISKKPSQNTIVGLAKPSSLSDENLQMVCFSSSTFSRRGPANLPYTTTNLQKSFEVRKTRPFFPHTMRSTHMYMKLTSS
jgi:hypothetical protein